MEAMTNEAAEYQRRALACAAADLRGMGYGPEVFVGIEERARAAASSVETFEDALYRLVLDVAADLHRFGQRCPFTRGNRCGAGRAR